jgi:lipopolysaccharide/colanic/teichoic acid biosynthesis glycosyltransferase
LNFRPQAGGEVERAPVCDAFAYRVVKRSLDLAGAALGLAVLAPLLALIAVLVKVSSRGPVFYTWRVLGQGARPFVGYKFRTMIVDADALKPRLWRHNERNGPLFKMRNDPRVTAVGRWLRKFSLDELPQLWSILRGHMSFVGPRPVSPEEWKHFTAEQRRKLAVRTGAVCLWHATGCPRQFEELIRLELEYVDHWSLWLDGRILAKAVWFVLLGRNY